ncbi:SHOCT domain-containing protein [Kribbella sp. NPDC049174]|uniref:SHOCT domain-containing protein n=1 Tax=Kribbella sp. NPDC049174 TaxID=3364112 RepID=UPI003711E660
MPGLLRGLARTAAVAGTATAVSGRVRRRQDAKFAGRDAQTDVARDEAYAEQTAPPPQAAPPPAAAPPPDATSDRLSQLKTLGELKQSGVLTEAEFEAQKAKILAG